MNSAELGKVGENLTAKYLYQKGFKIIAKNFHACYGELDVVATNNNLILFVEVKTRKPASLTRPSEAVLISKIHKILKTAAVFLEKNSKLKVLQPRFDVAEVWISGNYSKLNYIENAFEGNLEEICEESSIV